MEAQTEAVIRVGPEVVRIPQRVAELEAAMLKFCYEDWAFDAEELPSDHEDVLGDMNNERKEVESAMDERASLKKKQNIKQKN